MQKWARTPTDFEMFDHCRSCNTCQFYCLYSLLKIRRCIHCSMIVNETTIHHAPNDIDDSGNHIHMMEDSNDLQYILLQVSL